MMRHNLIRLQFMTMVPALLTGLGGSAGGDAIRPEGGPDLIERQRPSAPLLPDIGVSELIQPLPNWAPPSSASTAKVVLSVPARSDMSIDPNLKSVDPPSEDEESTDRPEEMSSSVSTARPGPVAPTNDRQPSDSESEPDGATPRVRSPERHIEVETLAPTRPRMDRPTIEAEGLQDGDRLEEVHVSRGALPTDALTDSTNMGVEDWASRLDDGRSQQPSREASSIDESPKFQAGGGEASLAKPSGNPADEAFPPDGTGRRQEREFDGRSGLIGQSDQDLEFGPEDRGAGRTGNSSMLDLAWTDALEADLSGEFGEALDQSGIGRTTELTDSSWNFAPDDDLLGGSRPVPGWNTDANLEALIQSSIEVEVLQRTHPDGSSILALEVAEEDATAGSDRLIPATGDRIALALSTPEPTPLIPVALVLLIGVRRWSQGSGGGKARPVWGRQ